MWVWVWWKDKKRKEKRMLHVVPQRPQAVQAAMTWPGSRNNSSRRRLFADDCPLPHEKEQEQENLLRWLEEEHEQLVEAKCRRWSINFFNDAQCHEGLHVVPSSAIDDSAPSGEAEDQ